MLTSALIGPERTEQVCLAGGCLAPGPAPAGGRAEEVREWRGVALPPGALLRYSCLPGHNLHGDPLRWCDGILW